VAIHVSHRLFEDRWNHGAITGAIVACPRAGVLSPGTPLG
jgi:hypothetical protein